MSQKQAEPVSIPITCLIEKCSLFTLILWYLKMSLWATQSLINSHVTFSILGLTLMYTCYLLAVLPNVRIGFFVSWVHPWPLSASRVCVILTTTLLSCSALLRVRSVFKDPAPFLPLLVSQALQTDHVPVWVTFFKVYFIY